MAQKLESSPPKTGEIKFVIRSIIPAITSDFTNVIKNSNDSVDNVLEFRSLVSNDFKDNKQTCNGDAANDKSYSADVKDFIQKILEREKLGEEPQNDSSGINESNDSGGSVSDTVVTKKQKINSSDGSPSSFPTMSSSTPIKCSDHRNLNLDVSGVGYLSFSNPDNHKNISLNDSDFESMDQDQYDESARQRDDEATLVNSAQSESDENKENMSIISRTSSLADFRIGLKMIFEETVRRTPLVIRKALNLDSGTRKLLTADNGAGSSVKKSKFMSLFSSTSKLRKKQSSSKKRHSRRSLSGAKRLPLTKENLQKFLNESDKETMEWGRNYDYSFACEPASSDVDENENSPNYISYNNSLDSSIEMLKSPLIPTFKIDPPADASSTSSMTTPSDVCPPAFDYVKHMIKCSYAAHTSLRRSMSVPAFEDNLEDDGDSLEFAYSQANTTKTCEASIKNLSQLSVSIFSQWFQFTRGWVCVSAAVDE